MVQDDSWSNVAEYGDRASAEAIVELLSSAQIPCRIASDAYIPGMGMDFQVLVPADARDAAMRLMEETRVPDDELTALALSEPREDP